jgi:EAL domain-containing protein (putative c-di-GMP-specific phosphodiesterase class I)
VLGEACAQVQAWRERGLDNLTVAVNLSPRHFASMGMAVKVAAVIERTGIDPGQLHLEITEGLLVGLNESILANFEALRLLGVKFAIDGFGIGYSSLGHLRRFSIDVLKIDRSFMQDLPGNADNAAIVTAVTAMANGLGLTVIAEAVETDAQLAFLRQVGCHQGQGFLFGHPMPAGEFLSLASGRLPKSLLL